MDMLLIQCANESLFPAETMRSFTPEIRTHHCELAFADVLSTSEDYAVLSLLLHRPIRHHIIVLWLQSDVIPNR